MTAGRRSSLRSAGWPACQGNRYSPYYFNTAAFNKYYYRVHKKANFPTRIAFRVFSSIDSRTIIDATGADRLVGRGDMLVSSGAEPVRVQCAFIDTPEIEELTEFIGSQQGYPMPCTFPNISTTVKLESRKLTSVKRDPMFDEAARLVIQPSARFNISYPEEAVYRL